MAMMYFFPSDEFQILENKFISSPRWRTARNLTALLPQRQRAEIFRREFGLKLATHAQRSAKKERRAGTGPPF
jgi:hypothetical protein